MKTVKGRDAAPRLGAPPRALPRPRHGLDALRNPIHCTQGWSRATQVATLQPRPPFEGRQGPTPGVVLAPRLGQCGASGGGLAAAMALLCGLSSGLRLRWLQRLVRFHGRLDALVDRQRGTPQPAGPWAQLWGPDVSTAADTVLTLRQLGYGWRLLVLRLG